MKGTQLEIKFPSWNKNKKQEAKPAIPDTPLMRQWKEIKSQYPNCILMFRCGDFYEMYMQDAVIASKILNITLTHRKTNTAEPIYEMAGFPFHALDNYLPKMVRAGLRVAIFNDITTTKRKK